MAASNLSDLVDAFEKEISCPICYEDFEEPKCLPKCAHNVCQHCLEKMTKKRNNIIECPVCREESVIPNGGVANFPKNHLVVRLAERSASKEKKSIKQALENCRRKLDSFKADVQEIGEHFATSKSKAEKIKREINSATEDAVSMIREHGQNMISEINLSLNEEKFATHKRNTSKLCENVASCLRVAQDTLHNGQISDLKKSSKCMVEKLNTFSKALDTRMCWAKCEFKQPFRVSLVKNDSVEKFSKDKCLLGKLTYKMNAQKPVTPKLIKYARSGFMIQIIDCSQHGTANIIPVSVTVSRTTGDFAVLDRMNYMYTFSENGEALANFCVEHCDPWDIAFLKDNRIVVLDRENNRLLYYNTHGIVNAEKEYSVPPQKNAKFSSLSVDSCDRFIISSCPSLHESDTLPCILVYSQSGELESLVGEGLLSSPEKAVSLNDKFFVVDSGERSVMVFSKSGLLLKKIGSFKLVIPCSIAVDYCKQHLAVCDGGNSTMQIYDQHGERQCRFQTEHAPIGVAFSKDCENLLICFSSS